MLKKLSLAALIAMGSMSVASATPLTEAIKGVDLSGYLRYRLTRKDNGTKKTISHEYKSVFKFTIPVNENIKVASKYVAKNKLDDADTNTKAPLQNAEMYLTYTQDALSVKAGKMSMKSPLTDADDYGTGALVSYNAGSATVAVGGFSSSTVTANNIIL